MILHSLAPYLSKVIRIKKRYAQYIDPKKDPYDVLLNEFEKGMTQEQMDPFLLIFGKSWCR